MSTSYQTPNMRLIVPVPTQQPGPDWAYNLNASLTFVDAHDHSPGKGVQITPSGINITGDLTFNNSYNAINLRSIRFTSQVSPIAGSSPDLGCLYESGVDLYYNDGNGNQVRITQSGSVAGSAGTITGLPSGTASAAYSAASGTFVFQQATSTAANMDVGSVIIRYPGSYPTPSGNYISLEAPSSLASGYSITLPALAAANNAIMLMSTAGVLSTVPADNVTITVSGGTLNVPAGGIGTNQLAAGAVTGAKIASATIASGNIADNAITANLMAAMPGGSTVSAGGFAITDTCGAFATTSTSFVTVTNLTLTITSTGRPIFLLVAPVSGNGSWTSKDTILFRILRNFATVLCSWQANNTYVDGSGTTQSSINPINFTTIDIVPAGGTYTYEFQVATGFGLSLAFSNVHFLAYEI